MVVEDPFEFHHGDCVGWDAESHELIRKGFPEVRIVVHPPLEWKFRAGCAGDEVRKPLSYLARNRQIVKSVEKLVVLPNTASWRSKGGTWYTHDYAKKVGKPYVVIWPNGETTTG
jgi:hypothetical protein